MVKDGYANSMFVSWRGGKWKGKENVQDGCQLYFKEVPKKQKIPWTEEPDRLQSMGSQRVGHD